MDNEMLQYFEARELDFQETHFLDQSGMSEKHIRIACPGITEDQIGLQPLPNGVRVEITEADEESLIFQHEFIYHHSEGSFALSQEDITLSGGVLLLVLKSFGQPRFKLCRNQQSNLLCIEEEKTMTMHIPEVFTMSCASSDDEEDLVPEPEQAEKYQLSGSVTPTSMASTSSKGMGEITTPKCRLRFCAVRSRIKHYSCFLTCVVACAVYVRLYIHFRL